MIRFLSLSLMLALCGCMKTEKPAAEQAPLTAATATSVPATDSVVAPAEGGAQ